MQVRRLLRDYEKIRIGRLFWGFPLIQMIWPVILIVLSNTMYNICAKATPNAVNPFFSLSITYLISAAVSMLLYACSRPEKGIAAQFAAMNWTGLVLGFVLVALEGGYIYAYRAGWNVSVLSIVANITLAVILVFVGVLGYKETLGVKQIWAWRRACWACF